MARGKQGGQAAAEDQRDAPARDNEGPGETQDQLAERQGGQETPAEVQAIANTHAEAASNRVLQPRRITEAEGAYNRWHAIVDPGVTRGDLERPSFWAHHTAFLRRKDEIRVDCADGSFVAYLLVRAVGPKDVLMYVREFIELESVTPDALEIPKEYDVEWAGDIAQWRVRRGKDVIREGFDTKSAAQQWLSTHIQSISR